MKVKQPKRLKDKELPLQFLISFHKVFDLFEKYAGNNFKDHVFHNYSKLMIREVEATPELIEGFSDFSLLKKYQNKIIINAFVSRAINV